MGYTLACSFAGCRCWAPAFGAAALAGLLRPCPVLGFPLVFRFVMGYTLLCSFAGCRCWAPAFGAAALAGLLRLALVYGRFGVFASSWLWGAFCRWPCPVLGFPLVFRIVMGYSLLCSFAGCRCWAPAPGAAGLAGLLRLASVYCCFSVFASSWLWGAFCSFGPIYLLGACCWFSRHGLEVLTSSCVWRANFGIGMECATRCVRSLWCVSFILGFWRGFICWWPCPVFVFLLFSWFGLGYDIFCPSAVCRWWAPAPALRLLPAS